MLAAWTNILPHFIVLWMQRRYAEKLCPEFKPCVIHYEDGDYSQILLEDCPTVTGYPMVLVEPLYRMSDRQIVGFQWDGKTPKAFLRQKELPPLVIGEPS